MQNLNNYLPLPAASIGMLPACAVLAPPGNKNEFIVRPGRKSF